MKTTYPCRICGTEGMAHPGNECADCYIAIQIVGGREMTVTDPERWTHINECIQIIKDGIAVGAYVIQRQGTPNRHSREELK
jgi:hypothetical protein